MISCSLCLVEKLAFENLMSVLGPYRLWKLTMVCHIKIQESDYCNNCVNGVGGTGSNFQVKSRAAISRDNLYNIIVAAPTSANSNLSYRNTHAADAYPPLRNSQ